MGKRFRIAFDVCPLSLVTVQGGVQSVQQRVHHSQGPCHQLWFTRNHIPVASQQPGGVRNVVRLEVRCPGRAHAPG